MYSVYKQIHKPTGIEHCIYCNLYSTDEKNLVIAGVNQLTIYRLNIDAEKVTSAGGDSEKQDETRRTKLECVGTFTLFGNVMSLQSVRLPGAVRDALILSFSDAKLSVLEYDPSTHNLKTSSLHQFEESELKDGFARPGGIPYVRVDPDGRCAAMLIYNSRLVILPFRRDIVIDDIDQATPGSSSSPILSTYIVDMRKLDERITNVIDFQFLHGYYEPTVFILYEPLMTWAGRTAVRSDTCAIAAISLNIQQKVHPIIWHINSLPFDCFMSIAIPRPIGGVLVFANNSLLYLNQSVPPYAVSLNSIAESCSMFPLRPQEGVRIALDCARAALISSDRLVLSLKGGELYVLTLVVDGMRTVRSFHFDKAASSVLTTCTCQCGDGFLFLGSRLGNSLLLKYTEKDQENIDKNEPDKKAVNEPSNKKRKIEGSEHLASDVTEIENLDELEVYGVSDTGASTTITSYVFEVCDNIWNISPCGHIEMGEPAFLSEEFDNSVDPDLELVTTSGYGKNGALSVLQRSIRPQVVTTFELPDCIDMWTVFNAQQDTDEKEKAEDNEESLALKGGHSFLILSRPDSSMVLQTGHEIMELDHSGFSTESPTVFAGNIGENKYILQVSTNSIRLLEGVKQLQHIPLDTGSVIVQCSVADPYVVIMMEDGQIMLLTLKEDSYGSGVRLAVTRPPISMKSAVLVVTAYKDVSGMFTTSTIVTDTHQVKSDHHDKIPERSSQSQENEEEDEDEMLYGAADTSVFTSSFNNTTENTENRPKKNEEKVITPTYWAVLCRENGQLEMYSVPEFKACYYVKNFPGGHKVLVDSGQGVDSVKTSSSSTSENQEVREQKERENYLELAKVKELLMVGLGYNKSHPYLLARVEEELFIYEAFPFQPSQNDQQNHLKIRFKKYQHDMVLKTKKSGKNKKKGEVDEEQPKKKMFVQTMRYFDDVSGYAGVFLCGSYPQWLFMTSKGVLRIHPMNIDGAVKCFTQFNNVNCPKGFLYFNQQSEMRICVLPTHVTYDAPWPIRKVPLRCTPHYVCYHNDSKTYAVLTSTTEIFNKQAKATSEEKEFEVVEKDERYVYPTEDIYTLQLFTPSTWELIPNSSYNLEEWEQATSLKCVRLKSEGTVSGLKGYIAVGTMHCYGEELQSKGRVLIFEVIEVVPEPGQPLTKTKIKLVLEKEQKGPVTAMADVNGFLLTAIGQKLYMWTLKDNDLSGVAFIDTFIYIHSLSTIKNLILAGDLLKSIALYRYQEDYKVLSLASRDIKPCEVYAVNFLVDNNILNFVVSDRNKNILVYSYHPEARESHGGQRLLRKADFNVGSHINSFFRVRCKLSDPFIDKKTLSLMDRRHVTYFATLDGSLGFLLPVSEKVYRRLTMLQSIMLTLIPHVAGLNPRAYRAIQTTFPELSNPHKNILDGELLWKFLHLSTNERNEVSKRIGTSTDQLIDDLMEIDRATAHF